jgi:hypothetical protein
VSLELVLEVLDPVGEVRPLAPHALEAVRDLLEQTFDDTTPVTPESPSDRNVADLDRRQAYVSPASRAG